MFSPMAVSQNKMSSMIQELLRVNQDRKKTDIVSLLRFEMSILLYIHPDWFGQDDLRSI